MTEIEDTFATPMERCTCIVLSVMPYRETSAIVTLFSRAHGRVGGIAKGIHRQKNRPVPLERGQVIDLVLYYRAHRELHIMSQVAILEYFNAIRSNLEKFTVRDAALEIIAKTLSATDAHPELYDFVHAFLARLENAPQGRACLPLLWGFIAGWSAHMGFGINIGNCLRCGSDRIMREGGRLSLDQDGIVCNECASSSKGSRSFIPAAPLRSLLTPDDASEGSGSLGLSEDLRITDALINYLRYHFDIRGELKTIAFLKSILTA